MGAESVPQVLDDAAICMEASSIFWRIFCELNLSLLHVLYCKRSVSDADFDVVQFCIYV